MEPIDIITFTLPLLLILLHTLKMSEKPPDLPLSKDAPVRILVQSMTQHVPKDQGTENDVYSDKLISMLNRISRHHWNCAYMPLKNRFYTHGDEFGYNNRLCFFLVDHGTATNDDEVPMLSYEWTGQELYVSFLSFPFLFFI